MLNEESLAFAEELAPLQGKMDSLTAALDIAKEDNKALRSNNEVMKHEVEKLSRVVTECESFRHQWQREENERKRL